MGGKEGYSGKGTRACPSEGRERAYGMNVPVQRGGGSVSEGGRGARVLGAV
jgi:hypothetical protein